MHPRTALTDYATGNGSPDRPDAIVVGDTSMSRADLATAADTFADRIAGAPAVAIRADATASTMVAVVGGLLAGVPVVPLPPDAGPIIPVMFAKGGVVVLVSVRDSEFEDWKTGDPVDAGLALGKIVAGEL